MKKIMIIDGGLREAKASTEVSCCNGETGWFSRKHLISDVDKDGLVESFLNHDG